MSMARCSLFSERPLCWDARDGGNALGARFLGLSLRSLTYFLSPVTCLYLCTGARAKRLPRHGIPVLVIGQGVSDIPRQPQGSPRVSRTLVCKVFLPQP